ncbi:pyridoxamine 5'-phosphate oxidase [Deinococcus maricopensis]|uniref:Pyridoxine/pyridoxamine 5'-phosphate oxidase n=1 Tax=Deinococcus maricopensis (strain DSM 21211 / LMG 22137 / NRRL B-23946 / LB-34) TaxID=709986 RepID=E8UA83_DEIML|nr:pyridoxamine 5'-phosphate oxidase [Deinococcus maricopensis]ADV67972.1 Pyridoxine/pyridoxamine 5'-phosphate oxidase [Deinococcus maricopensis DSM 21211]
MTDLTSLRLTYARGELRRADLHADPVQQFTRWLDEALRADLPEPYAMTLATADAQGRPSARTVLLRGADARGFTFYSNYDSHKGHDLNGNPHAELLFYWPQLERQVRVRGAVTRVPDEESDAYFHARPRESQLAAHASTPQSGVIQDRAALEAKFAALHAQYPEGTEVPRPAFWGGYRIVPDAFEFWQGRPNRMHDRFRYARTPGGWSADRLMP